MEAFWETIQGPAGSLCIFMALAFGSYFGVFIATSLLG